jgi:hypothetical protein
MVADFVIQEYEIANSTAESGWKKKILGRPAGANR